MHSFGRAFAAAVVLAVLATALRAQSLGPREAYANALARETAIRREIDAPIAPARRPDVIRRIRALVDTYDGIARTHPGSGYSDNALWQGAGLAADAFWHFGEAADRVTARRLLQGLSDRFPSSSLVKKVPALMTRLERAAVAPSASTQAAKSAPKPASKPVSVRVPAEPATLTEIRREVLPDAVRITLALEHETPFSSEQLQNPSRLFIDLQNTRAVYALKDARLTFEEDIVRQIRVGRQEGARTRVVLDLDGAGRSSIYPIYNPYRLVVDFERPRTQNAAMAPLAATKNPWTSTVGPKPPGASASTVGSPPVVPSVVGNARPTTGPAPAAGEAPTAPAIGPAAAPKSGPPSRPTIAPTPPSANTRGGFSLSRQLGLGAARIVIDPGHGGHDPGARVNGLTEAELVLDVALKLEKLLLLQPRVEVTLTRRTSTFVALEERTKIANQSGADLFLSIHANASENSSARGIETYFLNFALDAEAETIAARENAGSAKTMRNLTDIVRAIALNDKIDESRDFARFIQKWLYDRLKKVNRQAKNLGVKQAPFQVLIGAAMPSILAEISFITNRQEAGLLKTDKYRDQIAEALSKGVMEYQQALKRTPVVASQ